MIFNTNEVANAVTRLGRKLKCHISVEARVNAYSTKNVTVSFTLYISKRLEIITFNSIEELKIEINRLVLTR